MILVIQLGNVGGNVGGGILILDFTVTCLVAGNLVNKMSPPTPDGANQISSGARGGCSCSVRVVYCHEEGFLSLIANG